MTPPAQILETKGRKRASICQAGSGGKRGRKPDPSEHSKQENQDLQKADETNKQIEAQEKQVTPSELAEQPKMDNQKEAVNETEKKIEEVINEEKVEKVNNEEKVAEVSNEEKVEQEPKSEKDTPTEIKDQEQLKSEKDTPTEIKDQEQPKEKSEPAKGDHQEQVCQ
jgi:hypothetical protein